MGQAQVCIILELQKLQELQELQELQKLQELQELLWRELDEDNRNTWRHVCRVNTDLLP